MKINIPVKTFIKNNKFYFYDAYMNNVVRVSKNLFIEINKLLKIGIDQYLDQQVKTCEYDEVVHLIHKGYFNSNFIKEIQHPQITVVDTLVDRGLNSIILQVSCDCNFKCRYCQFAVDNNINRIHNKNCMSFETAKKSIDYLFEHSKDVDDITISFYGGEPLLNFTLIQQIVDYSTKLFEFKNIVFNMTSNISLLTEEIMDFIIVHNFRLMISMDGSKDIQNNHRKFSATGAGTYDIVLKHINMLRDKNISYFSNNVTFNAVIFQDESYEKVLSFFEEIGVEKNRVECTTASLTGIDYIERSTYNHNMKRDVQYNKSIDVILDQNLIKKMEIALKNKAKIMPIWHHNGPCIPGINRLFVDIYGQFYPCEKIINDPCVVIGNIDDGLNVEKIKSIMNIGSLSKENCKECWAMRFCDLCASVCVDIDNNCLSADKKKNMCEYVKYQASRYIDQMILAKDGGYIDE